MFLQVGGGSLHIYVWLWFLDFNSHICWNIMSRNFSWEWQYQQNTDSLYWKMAKVGKKNRNKTGTKGCVVYQVLSGVTKRIWWPVNENRLHYHIKYFTNCTSRRWKGKEGWRIWLTLFLSLEVFCVCLKLSMSPSLSACFTGQNYHLQGVRAIKRRVNVNATRIMGVWWAVLNILLPVSTCYMLLLFIYPPTL